MKQVIEVNNIQVYAHHGCLSEEAMIGGHYSVDLALLTDFERAAESDDLHQTIDYVVLNQIVSEEMKKRSKLIEHVGNRIYQRIRNELPRIHQLRVKITKISPPINGDVENVAIVISDLEAY